MSGAQKFDQEMSSLMAKVEEAKKNLQEEPELFVKSGQTKARGARIFSSPRVWLARRAPCIYRIAAFENRNIG